MPARSTHVPSSSAIRGNLEDAGARVLVAKLALPHDILEKGAGLRGAGSQFDHEVVEAFAVTLELA